MKKIIFILTILSLNPVFSSELNENDRPIEKWYYQITIGTQYQKYIGDINSTVNRIKKTTNRHQAHGEASLIGFYLPILNNKKSLFGFKYLTGTWDKYNNEFITIAFFGPSYMHYLDKIGKGIFLYTDLGVSHLVYDDSKIGEEIIDDRGIGGRVGFGYALPILDRTSFIVSFHNTTQAFDVGVVNTTSANIGFLW